jgi:hypothetical protein
MSEKMGHGAVCTEITQTLKRKQNNVKCPPIEKAGNTHAKMLAEVSFGKWNFRQFSPLPFAYLYAMKQFCPIGCTSDGDNPYVLCLPCWPQATCGFLLFSFFFFSILGLELRAYTLNYSTNPFFFVIDFFEIGSRELFAWAGFEL